VRRDPNMTEKAACLWLMYLDAIGEPIPREHAQAMTADQIMSLVEFDHYPVRYENGGTTHPDNLWARFIRAHREKTAKIDKPASAKAKRLDASNARHAVALALKNGHAIVPHDGELWLTGKSAEPRPKRKIPSRSFAQQRGQR
jgi:hypothetical protein